MKRRHLIATTCVAVMARAPVRAQQPVIPRIGFLIAGDPEPSWSHFHKAMADLGYVEGQNVTYERRASDADLERLTAHAAALAKLPVNVLVASLTPAFNAARRATAVSRIPVIFNAGAPELGAIANMNRPEGNLTGIHGVGSLLAGKSLQLFRELKPSTRSIAVLLNVPDPFHVLLKRVVEDAGRSLQIEVVPVMIKSSEELAAACAELARRGVDGVLVQPSLPLATVAELGIKHRLPTLSFRREFAETGGLMGYGADQTEIYRVVAGYVDKVLKGTPIADLPVQQATRYQLFVNQKTAKAIGLVIPPLFLARADEVIE